MPDVIEADIERQYVGSERVGGEGVRGEFEERRSMESQ